jgi:hypothetical protein
VQENRWVLLLLLTDWRLKLWFIVVELLLCRCEALNSNPSTAKTKPNKTKTKTLINKCHS